MRVAGSEALCRCGKVGCLEAVAGGWALVRDAELAVAEGATGALAQRTRDGEPLTPEAIARAAENGDALAISLIQRCARVVGESIAALVNMFNPGTIVIGGAVVGAGEVFLAEVRQRVYELSLPLATRDLNIVQSQNDLREPLRGGAEMVREQLFDVDLPALVRRRAADDRRRARHRLTLLSSFLLKRVDSRRKPVSPVTQTRGCARDDADRAARRCADHRPRRCARSVSRLPWIRSLPLTSPRRPS